MKIKLFLTGVMVWISCSFSQSQTKINNISFPDTYTAGKDKLILNGGGVREKYWMDMYVCVLYLPAKSKDAASIVSANTPMAIRINIVSGLITSQRMVEAVEEGFKRSTDGKQEAYKDKIARFEKAFSEEIKKGDVFDIVYTAEKLCVYKKDILKVEIEGIDFKKAIFGMWLGPNPVDGALKDALLGKSE